jgi:hypothetical protein
MKMWKAILAAALIASPAQAADDWVGIGTVAGHTVSIDMANLRKWIDGLVYFSDSMDDGDTYVLNAVDCRRRQIYVLGDSDHGELAGWRDKGTAVVAHSLGEAELETVCGKAGSEPLPGHWVGIGFGLSVDRDSIRRGPDGLLHFTTTDDTFRTFGPDAADCNRRLIYFGQDSGWQDRGREVAPKSFAEAELNYVCANVH